MLPLLETLTENVLDIVEAFDTATAPLGWYSVRDLLLESAPTVDFSDFLRLSERPELGSLAPFIAKLAEVSLWAKANEARFSNPTAGGKSFELILIRTSKIKVRKYGSAYQLDKQLSFPARWEALELENHVAALKRRKRTKAPVKMCLFLGFDRVPRPFEREIEAMKTHQHRAAHEIEFSSRVWKDRSGRGFWVRAALWARAFRKKTN